eukprot:CAMPEP_0205820840 /NCGR_PEP_ID=MMETSP0206-20130828/3516_1 /ASSEMBLY_ACC=CAM_ASM_000279 /TAXON_ID=36767 /ORGANISM="Euplotes focardii, Strain TN1" /LENGTH=216 /DNA_ID=CAMNT_0053115919 /DNA_START=3 /DNA_END=653 /DNA_ORIENTATION=+
MINEITEEEAINNLKDMFPAFEEGTLKMLLEENNFDIDKTMEDLINMGGQKDDIPPTRAPEQTTPSQTPEDNKDPTEEEGSAFDEPDSSNPINIPDPDSLTAINIAEPALEHKMSQEDMDAIIAAEMQMEYQQRADQYLIEQQIRKHTLQESQEHPSEGQSTSNSQQNQSHPPPQNAHPLQNPLPSLNSESGSNSLQNIVTEKEYEEIVFHHPKAI